MFASVVVLIVAFRRKSQNRANNSAFASPTVLPTQLPLVDRIGILNEMERQLILYLVEQSLQGKRVTVEAVNKLSGVAFKNEPIRRRTRSELINAINDKWLIISGNRERFVLSEKSDFDGRTREYFINEKLLASSLLRQIIQLIK